MNLDLKGAGELIRAVAGGLGSGEAPEIMVAPPFTSLAAAREALSGTPIKLGAQNLHWEAKGAFTGEVSASQLKDAGCWAVIIGHSERRQYFGETDETVNKRLKAALGAGLVPVVCIGETLEERESQRTWRVLETQIKGGLSGFAPTDLSSLVIAYEPVWAIGTGKTATPSQAQEAHLFIRKSLGKLYSDALAQGTRILYGGSVKPDNVDTLMSEADIDGALVGGASLKIDGFLRIIQFKAGVKR